MGNAPMTIGLKVDSGGDNRGIMAGSRLRGIIYLSVKQDAPVEAHSVRLRLVGTEVAEVCHTEAEAEHGNNRNTNTGSSNAPERNTDTIYGNNGHYNTLERQSHTIYNVDHSIKQFPHGVVSRGQYEFPFELELPKSLPSSMSAEAFDSKCEVKYEVIAEVFQKPNSIFHTNPNAKEQVTVVANPGITTASDNNTSLSLPVEIIPISECACCCCFGCARVGTMALEAEFAKTRLLLDTPPTTTPTRPGNNGSWGNNTNNASYSEPLVIRFRGSNKSTAEVSRVRARLIETIEWTANGHTKSVKTTLATATKDGTLYPELDKMWRKPFSWEQHRGNEANDLLLTRNPWRTIDPSLSVHSSRPTDTYNGISILVRHVLSLSLDTQGCCTTNPDATALVELYRNPAIYNEGFSVPAASEASAFATGYTDSTPVVATAVPLPEDWNATTAEVVTIPIAEATVLHGDAPGDGRYGHSK